MPDVAGRHAGKRPSDYLRSLTPFLPATVFFGTLAGAGVGARPLAANRQAAAMPHAAIAADVAQPRDVLRHLPAQLAFDRVVLVEQGRDPGDLVLVQVARLGRADRRPPCGTARGRSSDRRRTGTSARSTVGRSFGMSTPNKRGIKKILVLTAITQFGSRMTSNGLTIRRSGPWRLSTLLFNGADCCKPRRPRPGGGRSCSFHKFA